jgi:hypothetical protein
MFDGRHRSAYGPPPTARPSSQMAIPRPSGKGSSAMTDRTINLDRHRGMAAQKATEMRRLLKEIQANDKALRLRQQELETQLAAAPAATWSKAAKKAGYLLNLSPLLHARKRHAHGRSSRTCSRTSDVSLRPKEGTSSNRSGNPVSVALGSDRSMVVAKGPR